MYYLDKTYVLKVAVIQFKNQVYNSLKNIILYGRLPDNYLREYTLVLLHTVYI